MQLFLTHDVAEGNGRQKNVACKRSQGVVALEAKRLNSNNDVYR